MPRKTLQSGKDVRKFLSKTVLRLEAGELDGGTARSLAYVCSILLNALQCDELEERLKHLEFIAKVKR